MTRKHASWQFLPDELIGLSFRPSRQTICPLLGSDKGTPPCPGLAALPASPLLHADLKAWHLGQKPRPQPALPLPSPGLGVEQRPEPSSPWRARRLGAGPWPWFLGNTPESGALEP